MKLYPLLMKPFFRSGQDPPWGGDLLRDALLKDAPGTAGESLEVCADPGCDVGYYISDAMWDVEEAERFIRVIILRQFLFFHPAPSFLCNYTASV